MTATPALSPWGAPTLTDAVPNDSGTSTAAKRMASGQRRSAATLLSSARWLSSRSERTRQAALKEEQRVRHDIADLPAGWFVLRRPDAAGLGDHDHHIDQVAIGPSGVFMIYLEHQPAAKVWVSEYQLTINGRDSNSLRQARTEARRSSDRLTLACGFDVTVQTLLVLIGADAVQTLSRRAEVHVRTQHDLRDWLCKQPVRLDDEAVRAIYNAAGRVEPFRFQADDRGSSTTTGICREVLR
jgi:hypothetical protein